MYDFMLRNSIITLACIFYFSIAFSFLWEMYKLGLL